jgi:hypothetical protein
MLILEKRKEFQFCDLIAYLKKKKISKTSPKVVDESCLTSSRADKRKNVHHNYYQEWTMLLLLTYRWWKDFETTMNKFTYINLTT